jgi:hypothetical protein
MIARQPRFKRCGAGTNLSTAANQMPLLDRVAHERIRVSSGAHEGSNDFCGSVAATDGAFHLFTDDYTRAETDDERPIAAHTEKLVAWHVTPSARR